MKPRNPIHPGEILLEEFLVPMKLSQRQFARKLGWTTAKLNELVNAKRGVTADSALDLAEALGTSPEVWMNLQMMWDLNKAEQRRKASKKRIPHPDDSVDPARRFRLRTPSRAHRSDSGCRKRPLAPAVSFA
jgi:addiction module HigA family antidote